MAENKNLVEDALLQMKNLEEAVAENAKGILAATMGQEISELVKESLKEQTEDEAETDVEMDVEDGMEDEESSDVDTDMDTDNEMDMDMDVDMDMMGDDEMSDTSMDMDTDMDMDDEVIDLTNASDEEILKVFKAMGDEDGIIVKKDDNRVSLKDENEDTEYEIHLGESEEMETAEMDEAEQDEMGPYESEMNEDDDFYFNFDDEELDNKKFDHKKLDNKKFDDDEFDDEDTLDDLFSKEDEDEEEESEGVVYEIEMDDEETEEDYSEAVMEKSEEDESYDFTKSKKTETKEGAMTIKPKGVGMGKAKFSYKSQKGGFKEDMKHGNPKMGTGKPKFEYKEGKKSETKEAARTLGNGKKWGRNGLDKPRTSPRHIQVESAESKHLRNQVEILREKNEEYRKALNIFRQKLNEVAVFNSNLAYATRLFTEHSTSKQEKINILRRFDGVESIKESKSLYKTLKEEFSGKEGKVVTESIEQKIDRVPQSGSAVNLIESKTYENPQFLRMKDLMSKIIK